MEQQTVKRVSESVLSELAVTPEGEPELINRTWRIGYRISGESRNAFVDDEDINRLADALLACIRNEN